MTSNRLNGTKDSYEHSIWKPVPSLSSLGVVRPSLVKLPNSEKDGKDSERISGECEQDEKHPSLDLSGGDNEEGKALWSSTDKTTKWHILPCGQRQELG